MKPIKMTPQPPQNAVVQPTGGNGITAPVPIVQFPPAEAPAPVLDPAFTPGPAAAAPLPPPTPTPEGFGGFMEAALKARGTSLPHATFWANMAQAYASAQIADRLEALLKFIGADDENPDEVPLIVGVAVEAALAVDEERQRGSSKADEAPKKPKKG